MSTMRTMALLAPGLVLLGGCSMNDDGAGMEAKFCVQLAQSECDGIADLCSRERMDCVNIRAAVCDTRSQAERAMGRSFRAGNAGPCLDQTRATYRAGATIKAVDFQMLEAKCGRVYEGSAGSNDSCMADADCKGPLICDKRRCGELKMVAANANCGNPGERCPAEQYCKQGDGFFSCTARNAAGAVCSINAECTEDLRCRGTACIAKLPLDSECSRDDDCVSGYCDPYPPAGRPRTCATGLNFARFSPSCDGYFGATAGGNADAATAASLR
jgi:hypothetical protein